LHLSMDQGVVDLANEEVDDAQEIVIAERIEENDLIQTIQKFRIEYALDLAHHQVVHRFAGTLFPYGLEAQGGALLQVTRAEVGSHDQNGIAEVYGVAQTIGELAVLKYLQQDIVDVGMRLLNFVQQDDRVGRAPHAFGELASLFVAHIAGRRADQLGYGMLLHVFGHIEANQRLLAAEEELG